MPALLHAPETAKAYSMAAIGRPVAIKKQIANTKKGQAMADIIRATRYMKKKIQENGFKDTDFTLKDHDGVERTARVSVYTETGETAKDWDEVVFITIDCKPIGSMICAETAKDAADQLCHMADAIDGWKRGTKFLEAYFNEKILPHLTDSEPSDEFKYELQWFSDWYKSLHGKRPILKGSYAEIMAQAALEGVQ